MSKNFRNLVVFLTFGVLLTACHKKQPQHNMEDASNNQVSADSYNSQEGTVNTMNEDVNNMTESEDDVDFAQVSMVNFAFNSDKLQSSDIEKLDAQVKYLQENTSASLVIEGHTDYLGTKEYNLALGERRANSVKNYLVSKGIQDSRIEVVSYGKSKPIDPALTDEARAQNRRAVSLVK